MYEDEPQDRVHDVLAEAIFGEHPLGRRVIGEAEVIGSIPVPDIDAYHTSRYIGAEHRRRGGGQPRARRDRRARRAPRCRRTDERCRRPPPRTAAEAGAAGRLLREGDRAVPHLPRRRRDSRAATSAASRSACSTRSSAARPRRACSARCARSAASPTRSAPTPSSTRTAALVAMYVGTREENVGETLRDHRPRAGAPSRRRRLRRGARAGQGARQGAHGARPRVDRRRGCRGSRARSSSTSRCCRSTRCSRASTPSSRDDLAELAGELYDPATFSAACVGPSEERFRDALGPGQRGAGRGMIRVAVSGAAGRMGETVCEAVEGADDMELVGRADPALGHRRSPTSSATPTWSSTSRRRRAALGNVRECVAAGVHAVVGDDRLRPRRAARRGRAASRRDGARCFVAPNFAIGAVLMMQMASDGRAAHARVRDRRAPPRPQARRAVRHRQADRGADPRRPAATSTSRSTRSASPAWSLTRR